jgi:hypothetical protein
MPRRDVAVVCRKCGLSRRIGQGSLLDWV